MAIMQKIFLFALFLSLSSGTWINLNIKGDITKPLTQYVAAPDFTTKWTYDSEFRGEGYTVYVLNFTSQTYTPPGGATPGLYRHWLSICVPDNLDRSRASTAHINLGQGQDMIQPAPTTWNIDKFGYVDQLCQSTQIITAYLGNVPVQPYVFNTDPALKARIEDDILSYGWARYLNDTQKDPLWITKLAMVKSVVKAMDTVQLFSLSLGINRVPIIRDFVISGASKRAWTAWLVSAVDRRVAAIIPVVMPVQNMVPNFSSIFRCYGNWGFALQDYVNNGITKQINQPQFKYITDIEDPINYNRFIDMPKLVITGTKDEFFVPDQPKFFFKQLIGEKHLVAMPNGNHRTITSRSTLPQPFFYMSNSSSAFINQFTSRSQRPTYSYKLTYSNTTASVEFNVGYGTPSMVRLWQGTPPKTDMRDFRLTDGVIIQQYNWFSTVLTPVSRGVYRASVTKPAAGWTGFYIDAVYNTGKRGADTFSITTEVNIVPDRYPFPPCQETNNC